MSVESKHAYRFGYLKSEQWSTVRIEALARERGRCQVCGEESISNDAHHIWYPENIYETKAFHLAILCRPCHEFIHSIRPETIYKDEIEGIRAWNNFSGAVLRWRIARGTNLNEIAGLQGVSRMRELGARYDQLRKENRELVSLLQSYQDKFGNPNTSSASDIRIRVHTIYEELKSWSEAFIKKEGLDRKETSE